MNRLWKAICGEWEKVLFGACVFLLAVVILFWYGGFGAQSRNPYASKRAPPSPSLLGRTAFAFLDKEPEWDAEQNNPFSFAMKQKGKRKARWPWQKKKEPGKWKRAKPATPKKPAKKVAKPPVPKPKPKPKPKPTVKPKPKPKPKKKPVVRIVRYQGTMTTGSGIALGYVEIIDPKTKKKSLRFVKKGTTIQGVKVQGFSDKHLEIMDLKGRTRKIAYGEEKKIVLE